jgi:hypothetical protein
VADTPPLERLHDHLTATAELPVERTASHWLGEAEAVVADLVAADLDDDVAQQRLEHVRELLANVDATGDDAADDHVAAARDITDQLLDG